MVDLADCPFAFALHFPLPFSFAIFFAAGSGNAGALVLVIASTQQTQPRPGLARRTVAHIETAFSISTQRFRLTKKVFPRNLRISLYEIQHIQNLKNSVFISIAAGM